MSNDRNKTFDCKATKILALVPSGLAGPIQSFSKEGYKCVINFIDYYCGFTMLYFLKDKPDALLATMKYWANIAPYSHPKCLRIDNRTEFTSKTFQRLLVLDKLNTSSQLIFRIKLGPLNIYGELFFYHKVSPSWIKIARKHVHLHIDGFRVY